jgi:hypothetical protein
VTGPARGFTFGLGSNGGILVKHSTSEGLKNCWPVFSEIAPNRLARADLSVA